MLLIFFVLRVRFHNKYNIGLPTYITTRIHGTGGSDLYVLGVPAYLDKIGVLTIGVLSGPDTGKKTLFLLHNIGPLLLAFPMKNALGASLITSLHFFISCRDCRVL